MSEGMNGQRFCQNCGAPVPADSLFCPKCGAKLLVLEPVVEEVVEPVVEEAAPVVEEVVEPVIEKAAPVVEEVVEPVIEEAAPVVEEVAPVIEEAAPVVEEVPDVVIEAVAEEAPAGDGFVQAPSNEGFVQAPAGNGFQTAPANEGFVQAAPASDGFQAAPANGGFQAAPANEGFVQAAPASDGFQAAPANDGFQAAPAAGAFQQTSQGPGFSTSTQAAGDPAFTAQAAPPKKSGGKKKILIPIIIIAALLVVGVVAVLGGGGGSKDIDAGKYVSLDLSGYEGEGYAFAEIDYTGLIDAMTEAGVEYDAASDLAFSVYGTADPLTGLSNGDSVTVTLSWDEEDASEAKVNFTNTTVTLNVSGLEEKPENPMVGTWNATLISSGGVTLTPEEASLEFSCTFTEGGTVTALTNGADDGAGTYTFENDTLTISSAGSTMTGKINSDGDLELNLTDDIMVTMKKQ